MPLLKRRTEQGKPAQVEFRAGWCGPCCAVGPVVESLAEAYEGRAWVTKLRVDEHPETARRYAIRSIASGIKDGPVEDIQVGVFPIPYRNKSSGPARH